MAGLDRAIHRSENNFTEEKLGARAWSARREWREMRPFHPDATGPLDGIRVLDLSRLVAGNMLSLQLADFGAEVIKIEDPRKGDPLRDWRTNNISVHWKVYARNKKSVTLNLRDPDGLALLRKLAATAQVFIENFRPGTLEEM